MQRRGSRNYCLAESSIRPSASGHYQTFAQGRITHCFWVQENPDHPFIRSWSWQFFLHLTTTSPGTRES